TGAPRGNTGMRAVGADGDPGTADGQGRQPSDHLTPQSGGSDGLAIPDARRTPVPEPGAPPVPSAARSRFPPVQVAGASPGGEGTATGESTRTTRPAHGSRAERSIGPTLIPADAGDGDAATVMMSIDRGAAAAARTATAVVQTRPMRVGAVGDGDEAVEARTAPAIGATVRPAAADIPGGPPDDVSVAADAPTGRAGPRGGAGGAAATGAVPGPMVSPGEGAAVDPPSAVAARAALAAAGSGVHAPSALAEPTQDGVASRVPAARSDTAGPVAAPVRTDPSVVAGLAAGCLVAFLGVGVLGTLGAMNLDAIRAAVVSAKAGEPAPQAARSADAAPVGSASVDRPAAAAGPVLDFRSMAKQTRKLKVRCGLARGEGENEATVPVEAADACTVTAYLADRSRRTAAVRRAAAGTYICFAGDADTCERQ
ncbi:MAG: hypothetical protein VX000_01240, partial [Myxococcota bacterium]|nr:hypothetical protein [Myxococcota bacterium]